MSNSIDTRIVEMQFENSQFEKGVEESIRALEKLRKGLDMKGAESGLDHLRKIGDSFSLTHMASSIDAITQKFSALGVMGRRMLENITDGIYDASKAFVKDLSVDNISAGFSKYEEKTKAVQTILNATGNDIEFVNEQLDKLQWYTDETSYNYADMISNISKFTAMNVPLEEATSAMMGVANWAALSGQSGEKAAMAMYNISQAIGVGAMKLGDWKSIQLAMMGTPVFKQTAIDVAKVVGTLDKAGKTMKGTQVSVEQFDNTLSESWLTKPVLLATLKKFSEYSDEVYEASGHGAIPAARAMEQVSSAGMEMAESAFLAAQQYIVFSDTIKAVKDSVSTSWMSTFEIVFGDLHKANELWTILGDTLWEVFASSAAARNETLKLWANLGEGENGRPDFIQGLSDALEGLLGWINLVRDAWKEVFPGLTVEKLQKITAKVKELGANLKELYSPKQIFDGWDVVYIKTKVTGLEDIDKNLKRGARGDGVKALQKKLDELGYGDLLGKSGVDGIFGPKTEAALKKFVEDSELGITDIYDAATKQNIVDALGLGEKEKITGVQNIARYVDQLSPEAEKLKASLTSTFQSIHDALFGKENQETKSGLWKTITATAGSAFLFVDALLSMTTVTGAFEGIIGGVISAFSIFVKVLNFVLRVATALVPVFAPFVNMFLQIAGAIGRSITAFNKWLGKTGKLTKLGNKISNAFKPVAEWSKNAAQSILDFFGIKPRRGGVMGKGIDAIENLKKSLSGTNKQTLTFKNIYDKSVAKLKVNGSIGKITAAFGRLKEAFKSIKEPLKAQWKSFKKYLGEKFNALLNGIPDVIAKIGDALSEFVSDGVEVIAPWIEKIPSAVDKIKEFWKALTFEGDAKTGQAPGFLIRVRNAFNSLVDLLFGKGDPTVGKKAGLFRRIWKLIVGDLDGFTEGMSEEDKQKTLDRIQSVKDFINQVKDAIRLLFGGEQGDDSTLPEETAEKIRKFHDGVVGFFQAAYLLFTGNNAYQHEGDRKVSYETIHKIENVRLFIRRVISAIKLLIKGETDENDESIGSEAEEKILRIRRIISNVFNAFRYLFSGNENYKVNLPKGVAEAIDRVREFFGSVKNAIMLLATGDETQYANNLPTSVVAAIINIRLWFASVKAAIKTFVFGDENGEGGLASKFVSAIEAIGRFFSDVYAAIQTLITGDASHARNLPSSVISTIFAIRRWIIRIYNKARSIVFGNEDGEGGLAKNFTDAIDKIKEFFKTIREYVDVLIKGEDSKYCANLPNGILTTILQIRGWIATAWTATKNFVFGDENGEGGLAENAKKAIEAIGQFFKDVYGAIDTLVTGDTSKYGENGEELPKYVLIILAIHDWLDGIYKAIAKFATGDENSDLFPIVEGIVNKVAGWLRNIFAAVARLITGNEEFKGEGIPDWVLKAIDTVRDFLSKVFSAVRLLATGEGGEDLPDNVRTTILNIGSWLNGILDAIKGLFGGGGEESADGIEGLIGEKTSGLQSVMTSLTGSGGLFGAIGDINGVEKSGGGLGSTLKTAGIGLGITALIGKVSGFMKDLAVLRGGEDYARNQVPMLLQIAKVLKALAAAMLIIFAAVVVFSAMDSTALNNGISAIETIFDNIKVLLLELAGITLGDSAISNVVTGLIVKNGGKGSSSTVLSGIGQAIIGIGVAVAGITWAINNLPDGKEFEDGKKKVEEIFDILTNFISEIPFAAWLSGGLGFNLDFNTFKSFAEGIAILALVAHALSKIEDEDQFNEGVERVGVFIEGFKTLIADLAMMSAINNLTGGETKNFKMAGFIGVALAVAGLAYVANELSKIDDTQFNKGFERLDKIAGMLVGIPAVVTAIGAIGDLLGKSNTSFAQGAAGVAKAGGYAAIATGIVMALEGLLAGLAELVEWARDGEGKSLIEIIEEGGDVLGAISEGIGKFIGGFKSGFDKMQNAATDEEISGFGEAITSFADALSGTDYGEGELDSKIDAAIKTAQKIHDFFEGITENKLDDVNFQELSAFNSIVTNNNTQISDFGTAISGFASSLSVTGAVGLAVKVPFAISAAQQIADFLEQLGGMNIEQKAGKITGLFAKKTNGETVFESVKQMGENLAEAATALGSVGGGTGNVGQTVGEAVRAVQGVVELLASLDTHGNELPDVDEVDAWYGRGGKFQKLMWNVRQIGQTMSDYAGEIPTVDVSSYKSIQDGVNALKDIFSGNGSDSFSTDNFLKDFDATAVSTKLSTFVSEVSSAVTDNASTLADSASQFNSSGSGLVDAMAGGMGSNTAANTAASTMASNAATSANSQKSKFVNAGYNAVQGFADGIRNNAGLATTAAVYVAREAIKKFKFTLGERSPSRITFESGKHFDQGFANGITKYGKAVDKSATGVAESSLNTLNGTFTSLSTLADDNIDVQPTIAPVVDMTNIRSASGYMNGVFADRSFGVRTSLMASSIATSAGTATKAGQFGSPDVVSAIHEMNSRIGILGEQISNLKMVVDTGALVGQMAGPMDAKFGTMATMKGRMG